MKQLPKLLLSATLLLAGSVCLSQETSPLASPLEAAAKPQKAPTSKERRKASEFYLSGAHALEQNDPRLAEKNFLRATELDPEKKEYSGALAVARAHVVTLLVQEAEKARLTGNLTKARAKLGEALRLDPQNILVTQHIYELSERDIEHETEPAPEATVAGPPIVLSPKPGKQSLQLRGSSRDVLRRFLSLYGIEATIDESVRSQTTERIDLDDVDFDQAARIVCLITKTFFTPLDPKRVLIAADSKENRQRFQRQVVETLYLPGLTSTEMTDVGNVARQLFEAQQVAVEPQKGTITLRVPDQTLKAFNTTVADLVDGHSQVVLDVRLMQIAKTRTRDIGLILPQSSTAFNLLTEADSIINNNQTLVNEIVSSGLADAGDWEKIAAILIASGAISSSVLSQPFAVFGGGITETGLTLGSVGLKMALNSSDTRALDDVRLRVGDQEAGTVRSGTRYPITTSSYSSLASTSLGVSGLSTAGLSSTLLAALGISLTGTTTTTTIPQIQFEDLGLTLKATPHILKTGDVALAIDMKIEALGGSSLNDIPILDSRSFTGTITVPQERSALIVSNLTKQESNAVSGLPGVGELPGFSSATSDKSREQDVSRLVILITPHIVRQRLGDLKSPLIMMPRN